jgi:hypothetical protein
MTYESKIAAQEYWDKLPELNYGNIPIEFDGQVVIAKPLFDPFSLKIPSKEFIQKYRDSIKLVVRVAHDHNACIWWEKFVFTKDSEIFKDLGAHSYRSILYFDEDWKVVANTSSDNKSLELTNTTSGDQILIDTSNGIVQIINKTGNTSYILDNSKAITTSDDIRLTSENANDPAVLGDELDTLLNQILNSQINLINQINTWISSNSIPASSAGIAGWAALTGQITPIITEINTHISNIQTIKSFKVKLS